MKELLIFIAEAIKMGISVAIGLIISNAVLGVIAFTIEPDYKMSDSEKATIKRSVFFSQIFIVYLILINLL